MQGGGGCRKFEGFVGNLGGFAPPGKSEFLPLPVVSAINDGNRTNRSAINAIIMRVITKSTDRVAGG